MGLRALCGECVWGRCVVSVTGVCVCSECERCVCSECERCVGALCGVRVVANFNCCLLLVVIENAL